MSKLIAFLSELSTGFKVIAALIAVVSAIVGAALTVDDRYTHQEDFLAFLRSHTEESDKQHKKYLENRVTELVLKRAVQNNKLDKFDNLLLINYQQQLDDLK